MALDRPLGLLVSHLPRLLLSDEAAGIAAGDSAAPSPFPEPNSTRSYASVAPFRPGIAVIVGVLTIMFSLTFLLLLYAKHCKRTGAAYGGGGGGGFVVSRYPTSAVERRHSGVDRAVVDLLPVFRFGSLRGQKEGLECAVCLNRFEPAEALRLLPKCRHAFHVECVDTWLDAHSTCPLCRVRVDPEDILLVPRPEPESEPRDSGGGGGEKRRQSKSRGDGAAKAVPFPFARKFPGRHSSAGEGRSDSLQIVVHRIHDPADAKWWKRRSADCKGCAASASAAAGTDPDPEPLKVRKDGLLPTTTAEDQERLAFERRHSHRIVVSGGDEDLDRWSDLQPSDLLFLRTEMIVTGSGRFSVSKAAAALRSSKSAAAVTSRCASDLAGVSRFPPAPSGTGSAGFGGIRSAEEERTLRRWLGFAGKRTARWLGRREEGDDGGSNS